MCDGAGNTLAVGELVNRRMFTPQSFHLGCRFGIFIIKCWGGVEITLTVNHFNLKQAADQCGPKVESEGASYVDWIHFIWEDFPVEGGFLPAMAVRGLVERRGVQACLPGVAVCSAPPLTITLEPGVLLSPVAHRPHASFQAVKLHSAASSWLGLAFLTSPRGLPYASMLPVKWGGCCPAQCLPGLCVPGLWSMCGGFGGGGLLAPDGHPCVPQVPGTTVRTGQRGGQEGSRGEVAL